MKRLTQNELEKDVLSFWDENHTFEKTLKGRENNPFFSFFDGPPFATGLPHYGHMLASTIKDVVGRYQTMKGHYVPRRWGWDCHGLPIENIVEGEFKVSGKKEIEKIGIQKFNETCQSMVLQYANDWGEMVHRLGRWVDFENSYKTMDSTYMESVWWALKEIWDKDLIYEGRKVLLYCHRCETPISNFEVAMDNSYQDVTEESVTVRLRTRDKERFPKNTSILAWTTTPWTLPANFALAVGTDIDYVLIKTENEHLILAKDRLEEIEGEYEVMKEMKGSALEGVEYEPLYEIEGYSSEKGFHKVYIGDFVTTEDGVGIVHMAPYGEDDFKLAQDNNLDVVLILNDKGEMNENAPEFLQGKVFKESDREVKRDLQDRELLYKRQSKTHSYPFCWRCNSPLFYNPIPAWFINVQKVKNDLIKNNEDIAWYPDHLKEGRFKKGLEGAPDWNISRNRYWATALPFWKCDSDECDHKVCVGSLEELAEKATNYDEVYDSKEVKEVDLHKHNVDKIKLKCEKCESEMTRIEEVIDCWVESASMPFAELHYPFENKEAFDQRFPGDFVAEYIAQTRAWFYVTHVISTILFGKAPFKNVVTTGTILNEKGEKLSKSKKNYPDPWQMVEKYGMDALRFYFMSSVVMKAENLYFTEKVVDDIYKKVILLARNVLTFHKLYPSEGRKDDFDTKSLHVLDKWILGKLHMLIKEVTEDMDAYDTPAASLRIKNFIDDLSTWYLRRSRDRFKQNDVQGKEVLQYTLENLAKILAPVMPFTADHIYREVQGKEESAHLDTWSVYNEKYINEQEIKDMDAVKKVSNLALSLRAENGVKVRQPLQSVCVNSEFSEELQEILKDELNVKEVLKEKQEGDWKEKQEGGLEVALNIELNDELREEGYVREIIRSVNALRKKQGLSIQDRADIVFITEDEKLKAVIQKNEEDLKQSTLSENIEIQDSGESDQEIKLGDQKIGIRVTKK